MSMDEIAKLFVKCCSDETLAGILNGFLSCDDDEQLTDEEVNYGTMLFDSLMETVPQNMVDLAQDN